MNGTLEQVYTKLNCVIPSDTGDWRYLRILGIQALGSLEHSMYVFILQLVI